jgi:hypothetical protein
MTIGLPLLAGLTVDELTAILAHELGHFSNADTRLDAIVRRGREQITSTVVALRKHRILRQVFVEYQAVYLMVSQSVARRQELRADLRAAELTSPAAVISALREITVLQHAWPEYLKRIDPVNLGVRPSDLAEGFRRFLDDPARSGELAAVRAAAGDEQSGADQGSRTLRERLAEQNRVLLASHPPLRQRCTALAGLSDPGNTPDTTQALQLLGHNGVLPQDCFASFWVDNVRALPARAWDDIPEFVNGLRCRPGATAVRAAATAILGKPATVTDVLDLVDAGVALEIGTDDDTAAALISFLIQSAVDQGVWHGQVNWSGRVLTRIVDSAGAPIHITNQMAQDAITNNDTSTLRSLTIRDHDPATSE